MAEINGVQKSIGKRISTPKPCFKVLPLTMPQRPKRQQAKRHKPNVAQTTKKSGGKTTDGWQRRIKHNSLRRGDWPRLAV